MTSKPIAINENVSVRNRNVCEGNFVADPQAFYSGVMRDDDFDDFDVDEDHVTGMQESIFCAASPFSACCSLEYPTRDFLSVCFFCKCNLSHGKDVYMYKGDKAFCSSECRYQQIVVDEFKERQLSSANCYVGASTQNAKMFAGASAAVA